jgi:hypothetical protein
MVESKNSLFYSNISDFVSHPTSELSCLSPLLTTGTKAETATSRRRTPKRLYDNAGLNLLQLSCWTW